jgi:hypothetical protein
MALSKCTLNRILGVVLNQATVLLWSRVQVNLELDSGNGRLHCLEFESA